MSDKNVEKTKREVRLRRKVRGRISGTAIRPRLTVARSLKNIFVQLVDDEKQITLAAAASNSKNVVPQIKPGMNKTEIARQVGAVIAEEAKVKGVETVVFDRNKHAYRGRIKAVAEGARKSGLKF